MSIEKGTRNPEEQLTGSCTHCMAVSTTICSLCGKVICTSCSEGRERGTDKYTRLCKPRCRNCHHVFNFVDRDGLARVRCPKCKKNRWTREGMEDEA